MIDLDGGVGGQQLADELRANRRAILGRQACELVMISAWADVHNEDSLHTDTAGRVLPGMEQAKQYGGDGTPPVAEFATAELAALLGVAVDTARVQLRDALDLRHRHPQLWARLCTTATLADRPGYGDADGDPGPAPVPVWQARKIAQACHTAHLTLAQARWVDEMTTPLLGTLGWYRFEKILTAAIVQVDPDAAQARADAEATRRYVTKGRCDEHGLMTLILKATAGDVIALHATVHRLAQILALDGDPDPLEVRMSKAAGILANPHHAVALLARHAAVLPDQTTPAPTPAQSALDLFDDRDIDDREPVADPDSPPPPDTPPEEPPEPPPDRLRPLDLHPSADDADDAVGQGPPADPDVHTALLDAIRAGRLDATKLLPTAVLYVHLSAHALHHAVHPDPQPCPHCAAGETTVPACARGEGDLGPLLLDQVRSLLGHRNVTVKPVIDLNDHHAVDGYEVPAWMAEAQHLRSPGSAAPYSPNLSRTKQQDHTTAYRQASDGQPLTPGQTRPDNLGLLETFMHRVKTHGRGWRHHQPEPGVYLWRTPHGYWFRVDHAGTHDLGKHPDLRSYGLEPDDGA